MAKTARLRMLERARALIEDEGHWCPGDLARDAWGFSISAIDRDAEQRCALGALLAAAYGRKPMPIDADQVSAEETRSLFRDNCLLFMLLLLGLPGQSVPTGLADGLPMGVQIVGGRYQEERCLVASEVIEARVGRLTPIDPRA
jgi:Asp-tRNA(Asn)/Glu-tRNA(Gln) amidotransferase A subunit family amidase